MSSQLLRGDCLFELEKVPPKSVKCCLTSPPFWGTSEYTIPESHWKFGSVAILGKEPTFTEYVEHLVQVFDLVKRKLTDDGLLWMVVHEENFELKERMEREGWSILLGISYPDSLDTVYCFFNTFRNGIDEKVLDNIHTAQQILIRIQPNELWCPQIGYAFGKMPENIAKAAIFSTCMPGDMVLDPFAGIGTVGVIAKRYGYEYTLIEIDPKAMDMAEVRLMRGF